MAGKVVFTPQQLETWSCTDRMKEILEPLITNGNGLKLTKDNLPFLDGVEATAHVIRDFVLQRDAQLLIALIRKHHTVIAELKY